MRAAAAPSTETGSFTPAATAVEGQLLAGLLAPPAASDAK